MRIKEFFQSKKRRVAVAAVSLVTATVLAGGLTIYWIRKSGNTEFLFGMNGEMGGWGAGGGLVGASGVTSVGMAQENLGVKMESSLLVEEVYIGADDEVKQGDKVLKFGEESVEEVKKELEEALKEAELAYRAGAITYEQNKITAQYDRDSAVLGREQAQEIYEETVAGLEAGVESAEKELEEAKESIEEYKSAVNNDSFYEDYSVGKYKALYDENLKLLKAKMQEWGVGWSQVISGSGLSGNDGTGSSLPNFGSEGNTAGENGGGSSLGSSTGSAGAGSNISSGVDGNGSFIPVSLVAPSVSQGDNSQNNQQEVDSGSQYGQQENSDSAQNSSDSAQNSSQEGSQGNGNNGYVSVLISLYGVLEQNLKDYEQAQSDYDDAKVNTQFELQTLELKLSTLEKNLSQAKENYETEKLNAKLTYEKSLANGERAEKVHETAMEKAEADFEEQKDTWEEAKENLELFESSLGDGCYYASAAGTVLRSMVKAGQYLESEGTVFLYSNPEEITVTVTVDQDHIASVAVGDSAMVQAADLGNFQGSVTSINPVSSSESRTSVTYSVTVLLTGDTGSLTGNQSVTVMLGMGEAGEESSRQETMNSEAVSAVTEGNE